MLFKAITKKTESRKSVDVPKISRRSVLAAGVTFPFIVPRHVLGGQGYQTPSDTLRIAAVGVGGMGQKFLEGCAHEKIVALCDLDHTYKGTIETFKRYPNARRYRDYRRMFDKEADNFDALIIGTPDHTHTVILMDALKLGKKHIYCAKPITHSIGEARRVKTAVKEAGIVTKSSVQDSRTDKACCTTEILRSGILGPIREVHIWCDHPAYPCALTRPTDEQTPPSGMDWDLWIGPAPYRPFHSAYHPSLWRPWWDFGSGTVGDMACHTLHMYFKELKLEAPNLIYGSGSKRYKGYFLIQSTPECQSHANTVTWIYPARDDLPPLAVHWYDGGIKPHRPPELDSSTYLRSSGVLFVGEEGKLISGYYGGNPWSSAGKGLPGGLLLPEHKFKDFEQPPKTLTRCEDHYREWTEACKQGTTTVCPIEFGCEMTEMALLGTIVLKSRRVLEWDAAAMKFTNINQANQYVDPPYRKGWTV